MNSVTFTMKALEEYQYWQEQDKKTLRRINNLLHEITRTPYAGAGKPEPLKGNLSGFWSRRIDECNRLVYRVDQDTVTVCQCKGHY